MLTPHFLLSLRTVRLIFFGTSTMVSTALPTALLRMERLTK